MIRQLAAIALCFIVLQSCFAETEFIQLDESNWDQYVPKGKEVDAIYGDFVLRNEKIVAIIASPGKHRNANLTIRDIGGHILDLTSTDRPNDQLGCYYPLNGRFQFHDPEKLKVVQTDNGTIRVYIQSTAGPRDESVTICYSLSNEADFVEITHAINKKDGELVERDSFQDSIRADRSFKFETVEPNLFIANDDWFQQSYAILVPNGNLERVSNRRVVVKITPPKDSTARWIFPANSQLAAKGIALEKNGAQIASVELTLNSADQRVANAKLTVRRGDQTYGLARTDKQGTARFALPAGDYEVEVESLGQTKIKREIQVASAPVTLTIEFEKSAPVVKGTINNKQGNLVPCKVSFYGKGATPDPYFGPDSAANPVRNLVYVANGKFEQILPPGQYDVIVSRGPEFNAESLTVETKMGETTQLTATLERVVKTGGWVSTEYHSHSSPSGDNTSDQLGRVFNLLGEHIEFAPCTEHQRITSYLPHLRSLKAAKWMSTCTGMELTGTPLPINHQNAFPLIHRPRTQDGGAPRIHANPIVQIETLAYWDNKSEKLVQGNHPNLIQMTGDADLNGEVDDGFRKMFDYMDVVEVHPPHWIFQTPETALETGARGNVILNWMQLLNQGYRVYGVVNTDAHYNFHGSGWLRNYVKSSTDHPGKIDTMEMVRNSKNGHVVMTTGPFMEVSARESGDSNDPSIPGDDLAAKSGKVELSVKIQCSNWLDINRVQVFVNGKADPDLNFSRREKPADFGNGVVKFEKTITVNLENDAHLIVATIGEGLKLGKVMGPSAGEQPPCAVSNPIFVDVDGDGFQANGDFLGFPFLINK